MSTQDIVQKLWNLCNVLRDDGITYHQYVTELTYILFLKMADETGADKDIPEAYRWGSLTSRSGIDLKKHYYTLLSKLGEESVGRVAQIYANASSSIEEPKNLEKIITEIDKLDWYETKEEGLGDLYEGLLEKNANEKKSGAGQYFTPRVLIDVMTELIKPQLGDKCFDPACGTFGFMIAANRYVNAHNDVYALSDRQADFQQNKAFNGVELVHETHRLALMNAYEIISDGNVACIAAYEASTLFILNKLLELSQLPNKGQKEVNERYLRDCNIAFSDPKKEETLKYAFVNSRVLLIYGAAGTGKTTLIDMISTMLSGRRKLFLTKTHTALQNLQRRINNPGADASFVSINSFTKRVNLPDYDIIFVDECSTIDNRAMKVFLEKMRPDTFLVLAGDTYQIESIDFGNWFTYAKDIIKTKGSNVELVSTWRTKDPGLIELWNETRNKGALITEKLVIDGPFSENIGEGVLNSEIMDEVILCLNYDGKFGLNNMNSYFQNANTETAVVWRDWKYKVGDHILFNDTDRFSLLYNNLKGQIVQIELFDSRIRFTVDVEIPLTEQDCQNDGIEFIDIIDDVTRIRFDVLDFEEEMADEDRKKAIVPFQLAYAVSIHKAQGLEYRSVKVVIPSSNAEKITHGIFYTAITRAKEKLKIYWSSETMQEVVAGFSVDTSRQKSLAIIKEKLKQDKNT